MKKITGFFILLVLFVFSTKDVFAAFSFTISQADPVNITSKDQEIIVNLSLNSLPSGDSYFRVGWSSGSSYIGYIKNNNGDWVKLNSLTFDQNNQGCFTDYKISTSTSSAILTLKIGSDNDISNGDVVLKAQRFTSTCGSYTSSTNEFTTTISLPTPTASPTPAPTQTPNATITPTISPTKTPSPTATQTSKVLTPSPTLVIKNSNNPSPTASALVLTTSNTPSSSEVLSDSTIKDDSSQKDGFPFVQVILLIFGFILVGFGIWPFVRTRLKVYNESHVSNSEKDP